MTFNELKGANVLVTGGAGFIGGHLVDRLLALGARVSVLDHRHCQHDNFTLRVGTIEDKEFVGRAVKDQQVVFHLAANAEVPASMRHPVETHMVNVIGSIHIAKACAEHKAKLVFSSSCSVYGDRDNGGDPAKEWEPKQPESPYALQKLTVEGYVRIFGDQLGLDATTLRYFNVYGPRQNPESSYSGVIAKFGHAALHNSNVTVNGDGRQTRDFIFVDDVVRANLLAATNPKASGKIFNVGTGKRTRILDLIQIIQEITDKQLRIVPKPKRDGDVRHSCADTTYARETLGFIATHDITSGLAKTIHSLK